MARVPLLGGAYQMRSLIAGAQRSVNLFSENNPGEAQSPVPVTTYLTPGLRFLGRPSDQPGTPDPIPVPPTPPFFVEAVNFDGATYLSRGAPTGVVDSATGIFSVWLKSSSGDFGIILDNANQNMQFALSGSDRGVTAYLFDLANDNNLLFNSNAGVFSTTGWNHVLMAWNTNFPLGSRIYQVVVNGVSGALLNQEHGGPFVVDYSGADLWVGANGGGSFGGSFLTADEAELYFAPGQILDINDPANVARFRSSGGKPVDLGTDGSTPTGTAPALYLSRRIGDPAAAFLTNRGTGGDFTTASGALTAASTSPSD